MDETSINIRTHKKKHTWTNGQVALPYQSKSTHNKTIIGAVGGMNENVFSHSKITSSTTKEDVVSFLAEFLRVCPYAHSEIVLVTDNHSAHKSNLVKSFLATQNVQMIFMPPYSSVFSA